MAGTATGDERPRPVGWIDIVVSILVAFNLAVAQPLLDLLGRNPTFFVARRAPVGDLVLLALLFTIALPGAAVLVLLLIRQLNERAAAVVHGILLSAVLGLLALQILKRIGGVRSWPWLLLVGGALAAGVIGTLVFYRARQLRTVVRLLFPVPLAVALLFLFVSPVRTLVLDRSSFTLVANARITKPAPVVMIVFDEFPVASLMDGSGKIDRHLYPNFAALADRSTWFRNTTAAHDFTDKSVPEILTGIAQKRGQQPTAQDHPDNIFRLLAGSYEIHAKEALTALCPPATCKSRAVPPFATRWRGLLADVELVYEHQALPKALEEDRPAVDQSWGNFLAAGADDASGSNVKARDPKEDPLADFRSFLREIKAGTSRPQFNFIHVLIPHAPWRYLPSEQSFPYPTPLRGLDATGHGRAWTSDAWAAAQGYQRHLLQVGFADSLVGDLVRKLRSEGLLDKSLVVITADHGVSFQPGTDYRHIDRKTIPDIAPVPFILKRPGQTKGQIVDRPLETLDILPTIADALGVTNLFRTDGRSGFDTASRARADRIIYSQGYGPFHVGTSSTLPMVVVRRKLQLFGVGGRIQTLYGIAPEGYGDVLGLPARAVNLGRGLARLDNDAPYQNYDPAAAVIPTYVYGTITAGVAPGRVVAIGVNGRIAAVTTTYGFRGRILFGALVDPKRFRAGENSVEVFEVRGSPGARALIAL